VGEPVLIFPTTRTRGGDNRVKAGRVIEIPSQDDSPPFFTMRKSRADNTGENLIVLVTPAPIADLEIGEKASTLPMIRLQCGRNRGETAWVGWIWRTARARRGPRVRKKQRRCYPIINRGGACSTNTLLSSGATVADPVLVKVQLQYGKSTPRAVRR
jgi:hypothetical protein